MRPVLLCCLLLAAACGDDGGGQPDGGVTADADPLAPDADPAAPDANPACNAPPSPSPSWLATYQGEIVSKLAGASEISTGVTLSDRATPSRRATTRDYLLAELGALGYSAQSHAYGTGTNVWAELAGSGDSYVVIGAHYDSVTGSPGANDNATGVAMVLAAARYLRDVDCRTVNIIFVLFDEEEVGLVGSAAFATMLANSSMNVAAVHTVDQMGWDADGDRNIELEQPSTGLYNLYAAAKASGGFSFALLQTGTGSTDHVSFRTRGFRAIGITEEFVNGDTTPHYHQATDTYATVSFAYLASTSALVNHTLAQVATGQLAASQALAPPSWRGLPSRPRLFDPVRRELRAPAAATGCRHRR